MMISNVYQHGQKPALSLLGAEQPTFRLQAEDALLTQEFLLRNYCYTF